eukprot:8605217-Pyramimonas_sp.AAC.1
MFPATGGMRLQHSQAGFGPERRGIIFQLPPTALGLSMSSGPHCAASNAGHSRGHMPTGHQPTGNRTARPPTTAPDPWTTNARTIDSWRLGATPPAPLRRCQAENNRGCRNCGVEWRPPATCEPTPHPIMPWDRALRAAIHNAWLGAHNCNM